ncbi:hypothetical protein E2C01_073388 [Portunus trituberculatus]|uniref:Uncharacterized protein n=1 Tax=Portunus trituberculatus TaxID=210409 RepID=A0A5B7I9M1_PORTR|nr:hypothetical protein [Portunus trituberculatus]
MWQLVWVLKSFRETGRQQEAEISLRGLDRVSRRVLILAPALLARPFPRLATCYDFLHGTVNLSECVVCRLGEVMGR